jgi:hypothetical protein
MSKETVTEEAKRDFWQREMHLWKTEGAPLSWARWCKARELNEDDMPRPLYPPVQPAPLPPGYVSSYDQKQDRRRKRAHNAMKRAVRKEKAKAKQKNEEPNT